MGYYGDELRREYSAGYREGYEDGLRYAESQRGTTKKGMRRKTARRAYEPKKAKRKPTAYNRFVKKLSKQPKYKKMNNTRRLKAIGVAWRKTPAGRKKK